MTRRAPSPRTILGLATAVLLAAALAPSPFTRWITWFRGPFMTLLAPVAGPVTALSSWLRPAAFTDRFDDAPESELQRQIRELEMLLLTANSRIERLEERITEYERTTLYERPVPTRKLEASRISANLPAGTFDVNRGQRHGVVGGTVAVARRSEQLVGIVTAAGPLVSTVHVLTDRRLEPNLVVGIVMPDDARLSPEEFSALPRAQFRPTGDGALLADAVGAGDAARIQPGHIVRLADETWPSAASMLILGRVTRVEPTDDPLFYRVTAVPLADVARLRSIILVIPDASAEARGDGGGDGGGEGGRP